MCRQPDYNGDVQSTAASLLLPEIRRVGNAKMLGIPLSELILVARAKKHAAYAHYLSIFISFVIG